MTALYSAWSVGDFVRPSHTMFTVWVARWGGGDKPREIVNIALGMGGILWYTMKGFDIPCQDKELEFVRTPTIFDKLKRRLIS